MDMKRETVYSYVEHRLSLVAYFNNLHLHFTLTFT